MKYHFFGLLQFTDCRTLAALAAEKKIYTLDMAEYDVTLNSQKLNVDSLNI